MNARVVVIVLLATLALPMLAGCVRQPVVVDEPPSAPITPITTPSGVQLVSRATTSEVQVHSADGWGGRFWSGVNLGTTVPGKQPGEFGPSYDDFARWFEMMRVAHVEVIRIYTLLPPSFYAAFADYNHAHPSEPIWLLHGVWAPEVSLIVDDATGRDAFEPIVDDEFRERIGHAVAAVHGDLTLAPRRGFASGSYTHDVSDRLLGWVVGTEWFAPAVVATNDAHVGMPPYQGQYFQGSPDASPFESWLAAMLDHLAVATARFGDQHPVAITNWVTTDPLPHPNEPLAGEDLVSVDPTHVQPTSRWEAGQFALYHVYPYYPDLLRYEPQYQDHVSAAGTVDPYAGYLRALADVHPGMPIMVGEYGLPSSRGIAHLGPLGRDQGFHNETGQAKHFESMYRAIVGEGYAGALLFQWADEWFKRTWNTQNLEIPRERAALWRNMLTNEEHFGMLAMEPGAAASEVIQLDGSVADWDGRQARRIYEAPDLEVRVSHDAAYLYLMLRRTAGPWAEVHGDVVVGIDVLPEGIHRFGLTGAREFDSTPEVLFVFGDEGQAWIRAPYDMFARVYGAALRYTEFEESWAESTSPVVLPWRLPLNRPIVLPLTGEEIPFEFAEVGQLHHGLSHPLDAPPDVLKDWYRLDQIMEVRIPWMMLGFTDPSSRSVWDWPYVVDGIASRETAGIQVEVLWDDALGPHASAPIPYSWDEWNVPPYHERPKALYERVQNVYSEHD